MYRNNRIIEPDPQISERIARLETKMDDLPYLRDKIERIEGKIDSYIQEDKDWKLHLFKEMGNGFASKDKVDKMQLEVEKNTRLRIQVYVVVSILMSGVLGSAYFIISTMEKIWDVIKSLQ